MADRLANIAMDTGASIQVHASSDRSVMKEATTSLDNDVKHWLEASHAEHNAALQSPTLTPRDLIISRQDSARRRYALRGLVYLVDEVVVATVP